MLAFHHSISRLWITGFVLFTLATGTLAAEPRDQAAPANNAKLVELVGYVNYATIYRRSPVGLPVPAILKQAKLGDQEESLNRLLQDLAWNAVVEHPLSGLRP